MQGKFVRLKHTDLFCGHTEQDGCPQGYGETPNAVTLFLLLPLLRFQYNIDDPRGQNICQRRGAEMEIRIGRGVKDSHEYVCFDACLMARYTN